ncbi:cral-trio domain-containing protein [Citrus sinensis]|nr:cral-trio domain-containing protein [Citrus sinensis]
MPAVEKEAPVTLPETDEASNKETETPKSSSGDDAESEQKMPESGSFKEESTRVGDLPDNEKKALDELKQVVQEALNKHEFSAKTTPTPAPAATKEEEKKETEAVVAEEEEKPEQPSEPTKPEPEIAAQEEKETEVIEEKTAPEVAEAAEDDGAKTVEAIEETVVAVSSSVPQEQLPQSPEPKPEAKPAVTSENESKGTTTEPEMGPEEVYIWGIPLLADERSDVILLKFLRARDFKVKDAFTMLKNTIRWRKEFGIDDLIGQDLGDDLDKTVFMHGFDKEGHPVCYNVYGEFQNKELYQKTFSDEEKRQKFLRWRIQFLERSIRKLDFRPGGISTIVQVNDLKNSPGPAKWELRQATKQALQLLQDNYPEFVAKQVFINVPWWYLAVNRMISPFLTQRTRSKFVFAGPSKSAETLLRYIAAEQLPVKYGGLSKVGEFAATDAVTEITVKPAAKHTVEFPVTEECHLTWEVRVVGWEVSYGAEFVPSTEGSYTVIIQKAKKLASNAEQPVVCDSFKIVEPGKVVLTIDNPTSKKKKLLYRYRLKTKPSSGHQSFKDELCCA